MTLVLSKVQHDPSTSQSHSFGEPTPRHGVQIWTRCRSGEFEKKKCHVTLWMVSQRKERPEEVSRTRRKTYAPAPAASAASRGSAKPRGPERLSRPEEIIRSIPNLHHAASLQTPENRKYSALQSMLPLLNQYPCIARDLIYCVGAQVALLL